MISKLITAIIVLSASVTAATYNGKSVDGVSFGCSIKLKSEIHPCSVVLDGKSASVKLSKRLTFGSLPKLSTIRRISKDTLGKKLSYWK